MTDKQLKKIVKGFTAGILAGRSPEGMCYAVCLPLQGYISFTCKIETEIVECIVDANGGVCQHFYLKLPDGRILDPTASQFNKPDGKKMHSIYLGEKPSWYKIVIPLPKKTIEQNATS